MRAVADETNHDVGRRTGSEPFDQPVQAMPLPHEPSKADYPSAREAEFDRRALEFVRGRETFQIDAVRDHVDPGPVRPPRHEVRQLARDWKNGVGRSPSRPSLHEARTGSANPPKSARSCANGALTSSSRGTPRAGVRPCFRPASITIALVDHVRLESGAPLAASTRRGCSP